MINKQRTIALSVITIAAVIVLFAATTLVVNHQSMAQSSGNPHLPGLVGNPHTTSQGCSGNPHDQQGFRTCPGGARNH
jgi:hypothetical protein